MATWQEYDEHDAYGVSDEIPKVDTQSTPKIPPAFDGRSSWFAYEEAIDDWLDITTLDEDTRGPALKNRLIGSAAHALKRRGELRILSRRRFEINENPSILIDSPEILNFMENHPHQLDVNSKKGKNKEFK